MKRRVGVATAILIVVGLAVSVFRVLGIPRHHDYIDMVEGGQPVDLITAGSEVVPTAVMSRAERGVSVLGVVLEGSVATPDGSPAAGAAVGCYESRQVAPSMEVEADDVGAFLLACPGGDLRLTARHDSGSPVWLDLGRLNAGGTLTGISMRLENGRIVEGRVLRRDSNPVAALVVLFPSDDRSRAVMKETGNSGEFRALVGGGEWTVVAVDPDGRTVTASIGAVTQTSHVELVLPEWMPFTGRVEGEGVGGVTVLAFRDRETMSDTEPAAVREAFATLLLKGTFHRKATVKEGRFTFDALEPGTYDLWARSADAEGRTRIDSTSDAGAVISMWPTASLQIGITRRSTTEPVSGWFELSWRHGGGGTSSGEFSGNVVIRAVPPGVHRLTVVPTTGAPDTKSVVLHAGSNLLAWEIADSIRLAGRLIDGATLLPIAGAELSLPQRDHNGWARLKSPQAVSGPDGSFLLEVASGEAMVFVYREGYESTLVSADHSSEIRLVGGVPSDRILLEPP